MVRRQPISRLRRLTTSEIVQRCVGRALPTLLEIEVGRGRAVRAQLLSLVSFLKSFSRLALAAGSRPSRNSAGHQATVDVIAKS